MQLLQSHKKWSSLPPLLLLLFVSVVFTPTPTNALIEDVLDVLHVVKEVTSGVLKAWDIVQSSPLAANIDFPLMREKQRKVLQRLKEVSRKIDETEAQHSQYVALAIESVNNFISNNVPLLAKMNDITDTMNRISSRYQQMQSYETHKDKLEMSTLITFAEWTVSPNAHSVHHLMDRLHLTLLGNGNGNIDEPKPNSTSSNLLAQLAYNYESMYGYGQRTPVLEVDALRNDYFKLERDLWQYLEKTANSQNNRETQLRKVYDSHREFINKRQMARTFDDGKQYDIMHHYEWTLLEVKLLQLNGIFDFFKNHLMIGNSSNDLEERAVLDFTEEVLRNDKTFSMSQIFQEIESSMVKQTMYYRAMVKSSDEMCHTKQSPQQFVYSLYTDIALTELKGYTMMEFSWMMLRVYGRGNFTQEAELMRRDYEKRTERTLKLLKEVMRRADRIVWRCDPERHVPKVTYDEVTRLLQGYIENEVDLNADETCRETCSFYESTRSEGCFKEKYCARQPRCTGRLYNCQFVDSDMWVCPSPYNSTRRYEYIEYENGRTLGQRKACARGTTKVDSWWRYILWHCSYCFCLCDEQGMKSDRFFNLRESVSDVKQNRVVTGLRFVKRNRVFHLQIQEGQLLPRGTVNSSSLEWKPVDEYKIFDRNVAKGIDYHTMSYDSRSIDLDDIMKADDNSFVVTGVRFRVVGAHLNLEARLSEFDFKKGELIQPEVNSVWQSNDNTDVSGTRRQKLNLYNADVPTRTVVSSLVMSEHNQYIDFVNTGMDKDAAQSTVPFLDIQDVVSHPPVPLAGIGIYYKARPGYGGFVAPKIITYDFSPHVQVPKTIN